MPRFFFDIADEASIVRDSTGVDCEDVHGALEEAPRGLAGVVRDAMPAGWNSRFTATVRDEDNRSVLSVTITVSAVRL